MNIYLGSEELDPKTIGGDDIEAIYVGTDEVWKEDSGHTGYNTYTEIQGFDARYPSTFSNILSTLGFDYGNGFSPITTVYGGITNGNNIIAGVGMMETNTWQMTPYFGVFVITDPYSGIVDEYFVSNMLNTCEYQTNYWGLQQMFQNQNGFDASYTGGYAQTCGDSLDDIVALLYINKMT